MKRYDFTLQTDDNGRIHAYVQYRGVFVASRTFSPTEPMSAITEWCNDSAIWTRDLISSSVENKIAYSHDDGKIHVTGPLGTHTAIDPLDEFAWSRLVRKLKSTAPKITDVTIKEQPTLLPVPTADDLARRTIYTNIGTAAGVDGHGVNKPRPRYQKAAVSAERSREIAKNLLAEMFDL